MFFKNKDVKLLSSSQGHEITTKKTKGVPFSILGNQTFFQGKLILKGEARLAGQVEGTIVAEDILIVEEGANIKGEIQGNFVEICGIFEGILQVSGTLKITPTAQILGEISAAKLIVEEGARLKGQVNSLDAPRAFERENDA
ncbi:MAG: polymer-forming cytoskeletal protein [Bdellovibrionota bacterium]